MFKKYLSLALGVLLTNVLIAVPALARTQTNNRTQANNQTPAVEKIKIKVAKLGVGEKARATVHLKDGAKIKGYITQVRDDDFVIRDRQTNEPRTVSYQEVVKVDNNRGHSSARNLGIGIAIGAGAILAILAILITQSLD